MGRVTKEKNLKVVQKEQEFLPAAQFFIGDFDGHVFRQPALAFFLSLLQKELKNLHSSYVFSGPMGVGRKTSVRSLYALLACQSPLKTKHCGKCSSCQKLIKGVHPDFLTVSIELSGLADEIEKLIQRLRMSPHESTYRFIVLDGADKLSLPSAQVAANRLLKTLEEPRWRDHFFFITERTHGLMPTILSRSQIVSFRPLDPLMILPVLQSFTGLTSSQKEEISLLCDGSIQKALNLAQERLAVQTSPLSVWFSQLKQILLEKQRTPHKIYDLCLEANLWEKEKLVFGLGELQAVLHGEFLAQGQFSHSKWHIEIIKRLQNAIEEIKHNMPPLLVIERLFRG